MQNKICTRATPDGRMTIFNDKFIITRNGDKLPCTITGEQALNEILKEKFNISL